MAKQPHTYSWRIAQVSMNMAGYYRQLSVQTEQSRQARSQAITGAINGVLRQRIDTQRVGLEKERLGILKEEVEAKRRLEAEMAPLREARITEAEARAETARLEAAEAPARIERKRQAEEVAIARRDLGLLSDQANILGTLDERKRSWSRLRLEGYKAGYDIDPETGEPRWSAEAAARSAAVTGRSARARAEEQQLTQAGHLAQIIMGHQGEMVRGADLPGLSTQGMVQISADSKLAASKAMERLGYPSPVLDKMKQYERMMARIPGAGKALTVSADDNQRLALRNVQAGTHASTLRSEIEQAETYGIQHRLDIKDVLEGAKKELIHLEGEQEQLRFDLMALPSNVWELPEFGVVLEEMKDRVSSLTANARGQRNHVWNAYADAYSKRYPGKVSPGYWAPMTADEADMISDKVVAEHPEIGQPTAGAIPRQVAGALGETAFTEPQDVNEGIQIAEMLAELMGLQEGQGGPQQAQQRTDLRVKIRMLLDKRER